MLGTLVRILIISGGLALWELYLRDVYKMWLQSQDKAYGFGEAMLGYFAVIAVSYIVSMILVRRVQRREE